MKQLVNIVGKVRTGATAKSICIGLAEHYGATIKYGPDSETVQVLAAALNAIGVADKAEFLRTCSITVGDVIYLPFHVGKIENSMWLSQWPSQIAIVAHECQHVKQGGNAHLLFWLRYFTSKAHRAEFETSALAVTLETYYRLTGTMLDVKELAGGLAWYQVDKADIAVAEKHLAIVENTLERDGEVSEQMRVIVKALKGAK